MFRIIYGDYGFCRNLTGIPGMWNGANVLREEGWMHGTVVGAEPDGLVMDMGCEGLRRLVVPHGTAVHCMGGVGAQDRLRPGRAVEALLRRDPRSPWVWRPATLLTADIPETNYRWLAFVEAQMDGVARREVVDAEQVRLPPSAGDLLSRVIPEGEFVSTAYPLADLAGPLATGRMVQTEARCPGIPPFAVVEGEVLVLQRPDWTPYALDYHLRLVQAALKRFMEEEKVEEAGLPLAGDSGDEGEEEWVLWDVHHNVLEEMVTHLDTMERVRQRRVCKGFDALLSDSLSTDIRTTYCRWRGDGRRELYALAAPLLHCVTPRTRRIIFTNSAPYAVADVLHIVGICHQIGLCESGQRLSVVGGQCDVGVDGGFFWGDVDKLSGAVAGACCRRVLFNHCTMRSSLPGVVFSGAVGRSAVKEDLCRLVESQLPGFDGQRVAEWVAQAVQGQSAARQDIVADLNEFTRPDPRRSNVYAGHDWTVDNLAYVDVAKLSRLAQYALSRHLPSSVLEEPPVAQDL